MSRCLAHSTALTGVYGDNDGPVSLAPSSLSVPGSMSSALHHRSSPGAALPPLPCDCGLERHTLSCYVFLGMRDHSHIFNDWFDQSRLMDYADQVA